MRSTSRSAPCGADAPHHRYYDKDFAAHLEVRSSGTITIVGADPTVAAAARRAPERAQAYIELRQKFPTARAIAYLPPESAWRIAAFSLTDGFDAYLGAIGRSPPPMTVSRFFGAVALDPDQGPKDTYDGSHSPAK